MTIALIGTARRVAVFVLSHDPYCIALGRCDCTRRRDGKLLAGSLTVPARSRVPGLPEAVLAVPAIALAVRAGALRVEHAPLAEPIIEVVHEGGPRGAPISPRRGVR
jgi:hypothetical protein